MTTSLPRVERESAHIAIMRVATDEQPYLCTSMVSGFERVSTELAADPEVRVVLVEGGDRYFCAGARLDDLAAEDPVTSYVAQVPRAILSIAVPTIAVMSGHAIGGGLVLGLWCDLAVLAEESLYGANFMALGFTPGMGSTSVVPDAFGGPFGREMLLTGRLAKGREIRAASVPLSSAVVRRADVRARALAIATTLAEMPREALELAETRLKESRIAALERALSEEARMHAKLFADPATRSRIMDRYARALRPAP